MSRAALSTIVVHGRCVACLRRDRLRLWHVTPEWLVLVECECGAVWLDREEWGR